MRICSLLPSATEIVCALGLGDQLVAVTHECDYPTEATSLPNITASTLNHADSSSSEIHHHVSESVHNGSSIYSLDQPLLKQLDPDLILTQELCDVCAVSYREVQKAVRVLGGHQSVLSLEPTTLESILDTITEVGRATKTLKSANTLVQALRERINNVAIRAAEATSKPRVFAMEWLDPPFSGGHWVPEMIGLAAGSDGLAHIGELSRVVPWGDIVEYSPEIIILMPCGFGLEHTIAEFQRTMMPAEWNSIPAVQTGKVFAVDGSSYFNRPGPRIVDGLEILAEIIHPEIFPPSRLQLHWRQL
ncbi:cobalamin-binding protein [Dehalococcoidia bacterium]|nr:cobalamin-binding protein [Dehalococcoidia bacterium]